MNSKEKITKESFYKIDKKELKYYMDKVKGINYFKKQVPAIKSEEILVEYLKDSLANGKYICNNNSTVRFDNGLIVDSDWIVEFANFLITSLNNNENLSSDGLTYFFNTVTIPEEKGRDFKKYLKDIKLYEYSVSRKDEKKLTYQDTTDRGIVAVLEGEDIAVIGQIVAAPHGRLIDADTILFYQYGIDQWHRYTDELVVTQDDIEKVETIIEAEGK